MHDIQVALAAADADLGDVVRWGLLIVGDEPLGPGFAAFQRAWGDRGAPPVITMARVAGLAHPDLLAEIDAIAVVPVDPASQPHATPARRQVQRPVDAGTSAHASGRGVPIWSPPSVRAGAART